MGKHIISKSPALPFIKRTIGIGATFLSLAALGMAQESRAQPYASGAAPAALAYEYQGLDARLSELGRAFRGDVGIAVADVQTGQVVEYDGHTFFPQQSVSKLWVTLTALELAAHQRIDLDSRVTLTARDLTLFHQPIAALIKSRGSVETSLDRLIHRAMQQSDNTANDAVLRAVGGPQAVRSFLDRHGLGDVIRFGPGERLMQSRLAGLTWRPEYSHGRAFYVARSNVPLPRRKAAFARYVADPVDGATPVGMVQALARLKRGELLPPAAADRLLSIMSRTKTGPRRLKGGLAPGWTLAHKTGTGQQLQSVQTGYNDVGVITSPEGRSYAIAVMIRKTGAPIVDRMAMMQEVTRTVIDFDRRLASSGRMQLVANPPAGRSAGAMRGRTTR